MKKFPWYAYSFSLVALGALWAFGAMALAQDEKPAPKEKEVEADVVRCKKLVVKSADGLASVAVTQTGEGGVGFWVSDKYGSICIVAGVTKGQKPYFGVNPAYPTLRDSYACPLAISVDGEIQLCTKKDVKHIDVETLLKLAR